MSFFTPTFGNKKLLSGTSASIGTSTVKDITIPIPYYTTDEHGSPFTKILVNFSSVSCNTATRQLLIRAIVGGVVDTTAANYVGTVLAPTTGVTTLASFIETANATAADTWNGILEITNHGFLNECFYRASVRSNAISYTIFGAFRGISNTTAIDGIRFAWNGSGNFDGGTYTVYGEV